MSHSSFGRSLTMLHFLTFLTLWVCYSRQIRCAGAGRGVPCARWRSKMPGAPANVLNIPRPPKFATAGEEGLHRKRMLAAAFRLFSRFGFDEGVAGHITARDPERLDHFWVNPFGIHFGQIRASDLILVNHRGDVVEGKYPVNGAAFAIHSQVHEIGRASCRERV